MTCCIVFRRPTFQYIVKYLQDELATLKRQQMNRTLSTTSPMTFNRSSRDSQSLHEENQRISNSSTSTTNNSSNNNSNLNPLTLFFTSNRADNVNNNITMNNNNDLSESSDDTSFIRKLGDSITSIFTGTSNPMHSSRDSSPAESAIVYDPNSPKFDTSSRKQLLSTDPQSSIIKSSATKSPTSPWQNNNQFSSISRQNPNVWRDKYVMKASGWNAAKPDTGLPPSLVQGTNISSSPRSNTGPSNHHSSSMGKETPQSSSSSIDRNDDSNVSKSSSDNSNDSKSSHQSQGSVRSMEESHGVSSGIIMATVATGSSHDKINNDLDHDHGDDNKNES